ncbi:putative damage-inducible protein DinB [Bacillus pakistanensis]|uniref:Damage-inducible protein DinB n=1 Tax=Rossellomorea pakistanensis TaxID=992288 RepID=A0ABS2N6I3_9BACI|nr:DinB family protein [Bacillus pakistanensis]MBM7583472.1 putative damage-inducible protein DinB [Bacillus pakistanensis]
MDKRPEKDEYAEYYSTYVNLIPEGDIIHILKQQIEDTKELLSDISEEQESFRYAPGKWSLKEVIGHMADTERIMAWRLLCIARGETESLPGFDENSYVENASFDLQSMNELLENLYAVRLSTLHLLKGLREEKWLRRGMANGTAVSVRGLVSIIAGHDLHHIKIIKERYLQSVDYPAV